MAEPTNRLLVLAALFGIYMALPKEAAHSCVNTVTGNRNVVIRFEAKSLQIDSETIRAVIEQ